MGLDQFQMWIMDNEKDNDITGGIIFTPQRSSNCSLVVRLDFVAKEQEGKINVKKMTRQIKYLANHYSKPIIIIHFKNRIKCFRELWAQVKQEDSIKNKCRR